MGIKVLTWNCRSAFSSTKNVLISTWITSVAPKVDIIVLVETKRTLEKARKYKLHGYKLVGGADAIGKKGGVEIWVRSNKIDGGIKKLYGSSYSNHIAYVDLLIQNVQSRIIAVYGRSDYSTKNGKKKNQELQEIVEAWKEGNDKVIITGDLNHMNDLNFGEDTFILSGEGEEDTFLNSHGHTSRIDKCMITGLTGKLCHLARPIQANGKVISDHRPILFIEKNNNKNQKSKGKKRIFAPDWVLKTDYGKEKLIEHYKNISHLDWPLVAKSLMTCMFDIESYLLSSDEMQGVVLSAKHLYKEERALNPSPSITAKLRSKLLSKRTGNPLSLNEATSHFKDLAKGSLKWKWGNIYRKINSIPFKIRAKDVRKRIDKLKKSVSPGPSCTSAPMLRILKNEISLKLAKTFQYWIATGEPCDKWWKRGIITLIFKRNNPSDIKNWRPITLLNLEWKLFTGIVTLQLRKFNIDVGKFQIGWKKGRWSQENVLCGIALMQNNKHKKEGGAVCLDLSKAFDSIYQQCIVDRITSLLGIFWGRIIFNLLDKCYSCVYLKGKLGNWFPVRRGVRQGDVPSPDLFAIGFAPWLNYLDETMEGMDLFGIKISYLAYADDVFVPYKNQQQLKLLEDCCKEPLLSFGLKVNDKTKRIPFYDARKLEMKSRWKQSNSIRYLGVTFNQKGNICWNTLTKSLKKRLSILCAIVTDSSLLHHVQLANTYALSILIHSLYIAKPPDIIIDKWMRMTKEMLGRRGKKVRFRRLVTPYKDGGYGLWNIDAVGKRLKRSWISYIANQQEETHFTQLIDNWSIMNKERNNKLVGPLLSKSEYPVKCWKHLVYELKGISFYIEGLGKRQLWGLSENSKGSVLEALMYRQTFKGDVDKTALFWKHNGIISATCDSIPVELLQYGDATILRTAVNQVSINIEHALEPKGRKLCIPFKQSKKKIFGNCQDKDLWKKGIHYPLLLTSTQETFQVDGFGMKDVLQHCRKANVTYSIKYTVWDMLHKSVPLMDKSPGQENCLGCGKPLTSHHMLIDCSLRNKVILAFDTFWIKCDRWTQFLLIGYIMWRLHIWMKHKERNIGSLFGMLKELKSQPNIITEKYHRCIVKLFYYVK